MLKEILNYLKKNEIDDLIEYMDELKITNEMVKEHLMALCLDHKLKEQFDRIDTKIKSAFTRKYNKTHKEIERIGGKKNGKDDKDAILEESSENE